MRSDEICPAELLYTSEVRRDLGGALFCVICILPPRPHHGGVRGDFLRYFDPFYFFKLYKLYNGVTLSCYHRDWSLLRHCAPVSIIQ